MVRLPTARSAPSDAELVRAAREGDERAKESLWQRHSGMALGLAHRVLGGPPEDVDDVVQEAFLQAFAGLDRLDEGQAFAKWVGTIVVRAARRRIRRRQRWRRLGFGAAPIDPDGLVAPTAPPDVQAELRAIYARLHEMPADERIALVLRRVEGFTLPEIATRMELSLATVKRRLAAAEAHLAQVLEGRR